MMLDPAIFVAEISKGREIEICFRGKWYFFGIKKDKKADTYLFNEIPVTQPNSIVFVSNQHELLKTKVQDCTLIHVLSELDDYIIY